jgi:hypothetical protein
MKYAKLALISVIVFYIMFWAFSLLFPGTTVVSRVRQVAQPKLLLAKSFESGSTFFGSWLLAGQPSTALSIGPASFYPNNLVNTEPQPGADTIFFAIETGKDRRITGGIALYQFSADTTLTQLFYVFNTPWYKPWDKMATMMNDKRYGTGMDSALQRLATIVEANH